MGFWGFEKEGFLGFPGGFGGCLVWLGTDEVRLGLAGRPLWAGSQHPDCGCLGAKARVASWFFSGEEESIGRSVRA